MALALAEAGAKAELKKAQYAAQATQFPPGTEWELLHSDTVILLGMTHALKWVHMGCLSLAVRSYNSAI